MGLDIKHVNECYDDEENEKIKNKCLIKQIKIFLDRYGSLELTRFHLSFIFFFN